MPSGCWLVVRHFSTGSYPHRSLGTHCVCHAYLFLSQGFSYLAAVFVCLCTIWYGHFCAIDCSMHVFYLSFVSQCLVCSVLPTRLHFARPFFFMCKYFDFYSRHKRVASSHIHCLSSAPGGRGAWRVRWQTNACVRCRAIFLAVVCHGGSRLIGSVQC